MFQPQLIQDYLEEISQPDLPVADFLKRNIFIYTMWLLGIPAFIYGAVERGRFAFSGDLIQTVALSHCMVALVALLAWLAIGINVSFPESNGLIQPLSLSPKPLKFPSACIAQQTYRLPFSHRCQIYHLLNLKHLEDIHRFSLGNLKVTKVSYFKRTQSGGCMRFKTVLDSPLNILRLWREPRVEVDLILHTPHQIELKVPVYRERHIHVLFSVLPLNENEHTLTVQIFSNLPWPRELLRAVLIIAASLTLLEDLPYLKQLANTPINRSHRLSEDMTSAPAMQLFRRYIHLYGSHWEQA
ncbi:MAG: hypothetical protein HC922_05670 [Leptolyngbyaceae cyanobacterium SM2_3_12]|nr:hypothetical protein [Leptolyngbyaceae cyanobacterium SM2_3_12]